MENTESVIEQKFHVALDELIRELSSNLITSSIVVSGHFVKLEFNEAYVSDLYFRDTYVGTNESFIQKLYRRDIDIPFKDISTLTDEDIQYLKTKNIEYSFYINAIMFSLIKMEMEKRGHVLYSSLAAESIKDVVIIGNDKAKITFESHTLENLGITEMVIETDLWLDDWIRKQQENSDNNVLLNYLEKGPVFDLRPVMEMSIDITKCSGVFTEDDPELVFLVMDGTRQEVPFVTSTAAKKFIDFVTIAMSNFSGKTESKYEADALIRGRLDKIESLYVERMAKFEEQAMVMRNEYNSQLDSVTITLNEMLNKVSLKMDDLEKEHQVVMDKLIDSGEGAIERAIRNTNRKIEKLNELVESSIDILQRVPDELFERVEEETDDGA